jgi:hypothetical protein
MMLVEPKIIVMIVMLALPNGDSGVHVKPMATVDTCVQEANIEASDPFVRDVECAELDDGVLTLRFNRGDAKPADGTPAAAGASG